MFNKFFLMVLCGFIITFSSTVFSHGITSERIEAFNHLIAESPHDPTLYLKRGRALQDAEIWDHAIEDFQMALKVDPEFHEAIYWQGYAYLKTGELSKAEFALKQYLILEPNSSTGHKTLAQTYAKLEQVEKSVDYYDMTIQLNKNVQPQLYLERFRMLEQVKPFPLHRIKTGLLEGLERYGNIVNIVDLLVELSIKTKQYPEALSWLDKQPKSLKKTPTWMIKKARTLKLAGQSENATHLYKDVLMYLDALPLSKKSLNGFIKIRHEAERNLVLLVER